MTTALDRLTTMIPPDQALANKALAVSMMGITGISNMTLPQFASAVGGVQTLAGLPLLNAQTQAVSPAVANVIVSNSGTGTGPNGTITVGDILGTAAGVVSANVLANTVTTFSTMNLTGLTNVYSVMANTVNGAYGNPVTGPVVIANVTYANADVAFNTALLPAAYSQVGNVVATYPTQTTYLNAEWANIMSQLSLESSLQAKAGIEFDQLTANSSTDIFSFATQLPQYGQDIKVGGSAQFLQAVADFATLGGQAVVGTMRQGQSNLSATGVRTTDQVPSAPYPPLPNANLTPSHYPYP